MKGYNIIKDASQFSKIRDYLEDDISKKIYDKLVFYRLTNKYSYVYDVVRDYCKHDKYTLCDLIRDINGGVVNKIMLFGATDFAYVVMDLLNEYEISIDGLCDNDDIKQRDGFAYGKLKVHKPEMLVRQNIDAKWIITPITYNIKNEIKKELLGYGIPDENIILAVDYCGNQYFEEDIVYHSDKEVFLDCGSLDCDTSFRFSKWCKGNYEKIYSFEPDEVNLQKCRKNTEKHPKENIELLPYGVWDKRECLSFTNQSGGSCIDRNGKEVINTITIDEAVHDNIPTFIKMDIEGAELRALAGASETIKKHRPKLAISIYHKPEDLIEIPELIKELRPDYRLYIRHYSTTIFETILYAV